MSSRLAAGLALLAGVVTAAVAIAAVLTLSPAPAHPDGPTPFVAPSPTPSPSPTPTASPTSAVTTTASASPGPSGPPGASGSPSPSPTSATGLFGVGLPAPALQLHDLNGATIDLASLRGKPVWVNFMQTTCPPCQDEFPVMNGFSVRYASTGLVIVAVDIKEAAATVSAFASRLHTTFPMALDPDGTAQQAWGALALPVHFWIDRDGIVRFGALGGIGPDIMATGLRTILPGVNVSP